MHNRTNQRDGSFKPKGRFFWFVSDALIHCCLRRNMPTQTKSYYVCSGNVVWGWRWR